MRKFTFGIAGTFNRIHEGHLAMFRTIWNLAMCWDRVAIGVTTDEFARAGRDVPVRPHGERVKAVENVMATFCPLSFSIYAINSLEQSLELGARCDYVVVSEESLDRARPMLNAAGGPVLIVVPCVRGEDGKKISASDIVREELKNGECETVIPAGRLSYGRITPDEAKEYLKEIMDEWCREGEE